MSSSHALISDATKHNLFTFLCKAITACAQQEDDSNDLQLALSDLDDADEEHATLRSYFDRLEEYALRCEEEIVSLREALDRREEQLKIVREEKDCWEERTRTYKELFGAAVERKGR